MPFPLTPGVSYMTRDGKTVSVHAFGSDGMVQLTTQPGFIYGPYSFALDGPTLEARVISSREHEYDLLYPIVPEYEEI